MRKLLKMRVKALSALPDYSGLSHEELVDLAREKGVKGVPERMKRETIIKKLEAL